MKKFILLLVVCCSVLETQAQDTLFTYFEKGLLAKDFESFADNDGHVAIFFSTSTSTVPRTYKSHFLFNAAGKRKKLMLPLELRMFGHGYTAENFVFFLRTKEAAAMKLPQVDVFEMDKRGERIVKSTRFNFVKETVMTSFTDQGVFYMLTLLKKTGEIRIRVFKGANDPLVFTYKVSKGMYEELDDKVDGGFTFIHNQFEQTLAQVDSGNPFFLWQGKLLISVRGEKPAKDGTKTGLTFLELSITPESPGLVLRNLTLAHKKYLSFFPMGDHLYLFETVTDNFNLSIFSMATFEAVKTYSMENEGKVLLDSKLYESAGRKWWNLEFGKLKQPGTPEGNLKKISKASSFVYPLAVGNQVRVCLGKVEYPVSTAYSPGSSIPGGSVSTPYGSMTLPATTTAGRYSTTVSSNGEFTFLYGYINADLSVSKSTKDEGTVFQALGEFAEEDGNKRAAGRYEILLSPSATYLVAFSNKNEEFTVWSWPRK